MEREKREKIDNLLKQTHNSYETKRHFLLQKYLDEHAENKKEDKTGIIIAIGGNNNNNIRMKELLSKMDASKIIISGLPEEGLSKEKVEELSKAITVVEEPEFMKKAKDKVPFYKKVVEMHSKNR
ncbi:MAG: hypothetical protein AB7S44_02465 [Spirochaetales bacterium]